MKHLIKATAALAALVNVLAAAPSQAAVNSTNNWYIGASGDLTWLRHSDTGGGGNIDLGYKFNDWRLEAEAGYHGAGGDTGYSSTHYFTYMGNLYYDFNSIMPASPIRPFIGAGLGDAQIHYGRGSFSNTFHNHSNDFAWQGMAGINYVMPSMPATDWSLGYRYLGTDKQNLHASNLELGIRFHF